MYLNTNTLDNGLAALKAAASDIYLTSQEPATYTELTSTYKLGTKAFGVGNVFPGAIAAGSPNGRKLTTAAVTDGVINNSGTATHWGVGSSGASRLEVAQTLQASQGVTASNAFTLAAADVRLPSA